MPVLNHCRDTISCRDKDWRVVLVEPRKLAQPRFRACQTGFVRSPGEIGSLDVSPPPTVEELERWVAFGATWRLVEISDRGALVDLCQCTGELVEQRGSKDPIV